MIRVKAAKKKAQPSGNRLVSRIQLVGQQNATKAEADSKTWRSRDGEPRARALLPRSRMCTEKRNIYSRAIALLQSSLGDGDEIANSSESTYIHETLKMIHVKVQHVDSYSTLPAKVEVHDIRVGSSTVSNMRVRKGEEFYVATVKALASLETGGPSE